MSVMFGIGPCRTPLGFVSSYAAVPGCAPRPWAMEFYPYGVSWATFSPSSHHLSFPPHPKIALHSSPSFPNRFSNST
jgi:hypothetical protein